MAEALPDEVKERWEWTRAVREVILKECKSFQAVVTMATRNRKELLDPATKKRHAEVCPPLKDEIAAAKKEAGAVFGRLKKTFGSATAWNKLDEKRREGAASAQPLIEEWMRIRAPLVEKLEGLGKDLLDELVIPEFEFEPVEAGELSIENWKVGRPPFGDRG